MDIVDCFTRLSESATLCEMSWSDFGIAIIDEIVKEAPNKRVAHLIRHGKRLTKKKNIKRAMRNNYQHNGNKTLKNVKKENSSEGNE